VVAAKSLLATALLALVVVSAAFADNPTVRITTTDQRMAVGALLDQSDLGAGWEGGETRPSSLTSPSCPGFDPKESDLVVTGHADARFTYAPGGVVVDLDIEVLANPAAVHKDFARTITPQLPPCLAYQLGHEPNVSKATVVRVPFGVPISSVVSAAYRATIVVDSANAAGSVVSDYVYLGIGRAEYSFNVIAPVAAKPQLGAFELALVRKLLARADVSPS
jgi:hypothetical protein